MKKLGIGCLALLGLGVVLVVVIVIIVVVSSGGDDSGTDSATSGGSSKSKGLNADGEAENTVKRGAGFQLGDFKVAPGWKVSKSFLGYNIKGLEVKNTTKSDHQFSVDFKLRNGPRVAADITCFADQAKPGDIVEVDCLPDGEGKPYKTITVGNTF